ncbi:PilC/PilY family type IV pilus protein [Acinetobacter lwoffii]|uniref:PilC/PilY family type IV pilus protein n=1 Tax=Acinetobacter lwoffii TaxID=28090 RepID=UPI00209AC88B|nr:PilC/PilY family type IV pilus protein [Acinetobacter lwoffii]MCO8093802.1 PilC/PilY family type IV pilus protein [Acinetobacter lwoffii]
MKQLKNNFLSSCRYRVLAASVAALSTALVTTSVTQAGDIEIYQNAKSGDITLMFMLDISGSMGSTDAGVSGTRLKRVQDAMSDLLSGNTAKGITRLDDDKIIGLATFDYSVGHVRIPARRLGDIVSGTTTQRQLLLNFATNLPANNGTTPTANAYADVGAYLMGTTTKGVDRSGFSNGSTTGNNKVRDNDKYIQPVSLQQTEEVKKCSGQGIYVLTDGEPNQSSPTIASNLMKKALNVSSFSCSGSFLPEVNNPSYGQTGAWSCIGNFSQKLLNADQNPAKLKIKTAVVGFGSTFNGLPSYDQTLTQEENLRNINNATINSTIANDIRNAARWGILGEGGWYSGNSSQDIVDSVNDFISNLSKEIPSVTTGSPTIPRDALNPAELQDEAYYQTFQPTPNTNYQLWLGNLKKFEVSEKGILKGKNGLNVFEKDGRLKEPTYDEDTGNIITYVEDYWAKAVNPSVANSDEDTVGSKKFAARGGAWSQMLLGATAQNTAERKLFTNRKAIVSGGTTTFGGTGSLRQIELADIENTTYKNDPNRGYLLSLLGYNIDLSKLPTTVTNLKAQPALRQMGAVMHSYPVLVTNKGKLEYNKSKKAMEAKDREDYILFGTTQGLLHFVDAETGVEKFAFVPNEMVENQKDAFRLSNVTNGGMQKLYYGVDGPWALYTQYVVDSSGNLVVGSGRTASQTGMQIAYGGLRMGGRSYYALDLSNINKPELKFHIDPASQKVYSGSSSKTFSQLQYMGQSWSKPSITWVNWGGTRKRVMFVGGGYDAGGDDGDARTNGVKGSYAGYENHDYPQTNKKGAGVYMFDADSGDLLWWASDNVSSTSAASTNSGVISTKHAELKYSVVSEIRTVDRDGDDLTDHIYFGDLGGQLFRIDFDNKQKTIGAVPQTPIKLLTLNAGAKSPRFYDMPGFSLYNQNGDTFAVISIGSGNRSEPLKDFTSSDTTYDYDSIYNIYDKDVARRDLFNRTSPLKTQNLKKENLGEITEGNRFSNTDPVASYDRKSGWFYRFQNCTVGVDGQLTNCSNYKKQSEKVFGTPLAMNYKLYVSTFDASKPGISGDCGAGVKGESMLTSFCLPFGQCASRLEPSRSVIGVGIHTVTVGGKKGGGGGGGGGGGEDCTGDSCPPKDCEGEACPPDATGETSAKNYCINTSGRIALTVTGGFGDGEATEICLIPQRWYEKLARKAS